MNEITEIITGKLYVSGIGPLRRQRRIRVTLLINTASDLRNIAGPWRNIKISLVDSPDENIYKYLDYITNVINNELNRRNGKVLIYCRYGVSRSCSFIIAYLIKKYNMSVDNAYDFITRKRSIAMPNKGFMKQLRMFEKENIDMTI